MTMSNLELLNKILEYTIWLPIKDYENYEVSICGSVRNITTKKFLKPYICKSGYYYVALSKNGIKKKFKIHRLIAIHFIPNIFNKEFVDHIDNFKLNNTISNLRWCTCQQNQFNKKVYKHSTTGIKGVVWIESIKKWRAKIGYNKRTIYLGSFTNIDDAIKARKEMAAELFGEFLNEIEK